jgi:magnesium-transporting ATPase (P-type)
LLPIQKAEVVRIVRVRLNKITLSIGDGANDVPMIKTAHIGIGLFGEEGMGAVLASDYALPEFRMLWRLLLVHGRWNYIRISEMILYFFYKNMLFTIPQFIFAFYCGFSGQTIFDDIYITLYNLTFTSLPLVVRAVLEQDVYYVQPTRSDPVEDEAANKIVRVNTSYSQPVRSEPLEDESVNQITQVNKPYVLNSQQGKYVPKEYEMNKFLYRLFPKIYFIGQ